ncbi:hypothetical protein CBR_g40514 [Chara braunii]|uniref:Aspartic peptidase DDI1-type domain-containing protein n=1 Tax=Chara braunii TaxID=69332 RepID=A0A388K1Z6_CHABU|nr:hypothetical protein CBR_g40514 [Chara braunii]|eukprot:GBG64068.1 hypothetical protein CBR_g40514 [Chara braunii]
MIDAKVTEEKKGKEPMSTTSPRKKRPKKFEMKCTLDEIDTVAPLRRTLMQPMQCTLLEYLAASKSARNELLSITKKVRIPPAGRPTGPGDGPAKEEVQSSRITMEELPASFFLEDEGKKFYVLGSGQLQAVVSGKKMRGLVDNGSESTVCRDSIAKELGLEVDRGVSMSMVVADNKLQPAEGVCHNPLIEVEGVEVTASIFSVKECSSELILGRTWLSAVHATTVDLPDEVRPYRSKVRTGSKWFSRWWMLKMSGTELVFGGGRKPSHECVGSGKKNRPLPTKNSRGTGRTSSMLGDEL